MPCQSFWAYCLFAEGWGGDEFLLKAIMQYLTIGAEDTSTTACVCAGPWSVPHWPHCMVPASCGAPALTATSPAQPSRCCHPGPGSVSHKYVPAVSSWAGLGWAGQDILIRQELYLMLGAAAHPATAYLSHQDSKDQGTTATDATHA